MNKPYFTIINQYVREKMNLSLSEYCIADSICKLSNQHSWCTISQDELAKFINISRQQVNRIIKKLVELGYVEKHENEKKIKITRKWIKEFELFESNKMLHTKENECNKMLHKNNVLSNKMLQKSNKMLQYNNININNKYKEVNATAQSGFVNENHSLTPGFKKKFTKINFRQVEELIKYLENKIGFNLDGAKMNSIMVKHLYKSVCENFPNGEPISKIKEIIDMGYKIPFHKQNMTNFRYIYNNWVKIMKQGIEMFPKVETDDYNYSERIKRSQNCKLGCDNGFISKRVNGYDVIVLCECCKDLFENI